MDIEQIAADWEEGSQQFEFHVNRLLKLLTGNRPALIELRGMLKGFQQSTLASKNGFEFIAQELTKLKP